MLIAHYTTQKKKKIVLYARLIDDNVSKKKR